MAANPKQELLELVARLSDEEAARLLDDARRLMDRPRQGHDLPTLHTAPPIVSIDDPRGDVFPSEESVEEFDATIRFRHVRSALPATT